MKYLITNPDSFGDIVLRQPIFKALLDSGHEVGLLVKQSYSQIVRFLDPRLRIIMMADLNPYTIAILEDRDKVEAAIDQAEQFDPDIIVVAPYQRTLIDIWTVDRFKRKHVVGMKGIEVVYKNGQRLFRPTTYAGNAVLHVPEDLSEIEKNRRLLSLILDQEVFEYTPVMSLPPATLQLAREVLKQFQLKPRSYIICTPGSTSLAVKQYPPERFVNILSYWAERYKRNVLLVSNEHELPICKEIQSALKERSILSQIWTGNESTLEVLLGLISFAKVYFGNDTGPMHFAGALDKPVVAIFGGGTWPRFIPAAEEGVAILQELPCFGCGWRCVFEHAVCIRDVREDWVINAIDQFEAKKLRPFTILSNPFEGDVVNEWITEAKDQLKSYKTQLVSVNDTLEQQSAAIAMSQSEVSALHEKLYALTKDASAKEEFIRELQQVLLKKEEVYASQTDELREQLDAQKRNALNLDSQLELEMSQAATMRSQLIEQQSIAIGLQKQLLEEKSRTREIEQLYDLERKTSSQLIKQLAEERTTCADFRNQLDELGRAAAAAQALAQKELSRERASADGVRQQLLKEQELITTLRRQFQEQEKLTAFAKSRAELLSNQLLGINSVLRRAYSAIIDIKPKLEELHLAIRQQDELLQRFEGNLVGFAQSGWVRMGVAIGIPWLSRWHKMVFRQDGGDTVPVVAREEFENPLSVKDNLMISINEIASLLSELQ